MQVLIMIMKMTTLDKLLIHNLDKFEEIIEKTLENIGTKHIES
jgi:hypothetical protein